MKKVFFILFTFLFFIAAQANAGFLVEPYVGVGQSISALDLATGADPEDESESTTSLGARLGYGILGTLYAGVDYEMISINSDTSSDLSVFVGIDLPILLRVWAEYFVSSDFEVNQTGVTNFDFDNGYGAGVGFTFLPLVSLNLEVKQLNYTARIGGIDADIATAQYLATVSLPLDF
jgi:hypothetical protein